MNLEEIQKKVQNLEQQIISSYKNASILDDVCTLEPVSPDHQYGNFHKFDNRYKIEREYIYDSTHYLIVNDFGLEVARSEIALLIDEFVKQSPTRELKEFSINEIKKAVYDIQSHYCRPKPTVIFIPDKYFDEVFEWNQRQMLVPQELWKNLALDPITKLQVKYSSEYAKFDDIIITSKSENIWQYRPDERTNERLIAKFYWENHEDPLNTILEVKTVFNFEIKRKEANMVLKLPCTEKKNKL